MCSRLNICSVTVLDNLLKLDDPFRIEIVFEVFEYIKEEVEWELIFVATDGSEERDQLLDAVEIGQIRDGRHKFVFEAPAPALNSLRPEDLTDVTLLLLKCKYREQLFLKVGWFVTHVYTDPELLTNPPEHPDPTKMQRSISVDDYRVTTYAIKWDDLPEEKVNSDEEQDTTSTVNVNDKDVTEMDLDAVSSQKSELSVKVESLNISSQAATNEELIEDKTENKMINESHNTPLVDKTNC